VLQKATHAMTAPSSIDPARFLHEHLASASPDLLSTPQPSRRSTWVAAGTAVDIQSET
jgi:hypothetical protein